MLGRKYDPTLDIPAILERLKEDVTHALTHDTRLLGIHVSLRQIPATGVDVILIQVDKSPHTRYSPQASYVLGILSGLGVAYRSPEDYPSNYRLWVE